MERKRVALVTGAGRGIGRGIALELAREGFKIAGCDIVFDSKNTSSGLFEVRAEAAKLGAAFLAIKGDVSNLAEHDRILAAVQIEYGRLDVLVHNAGVAPEIRADVLETSPESFDRVLGVNMRGPFFLTQKAVPRLLATATLDAAFKPSIVFITSISAVVSSTARAEYCLSKAALSMAARIFADRLAESGIGVYEVRPGIIETDMTVPVREKYDALIAGGLVPQKRWGRPEDVGRAVAALVRGGFGYSTGLVLEVSGGMDIRRL
jgi:3-oxoacyl-[acyl-carrier protein] reductase